MLSPKDNPPTLQEFGKRLITDFQSWTKETNPPAAAYNQARYETLQILAQANVGGQTFNESKLTQAR